MNTLQLNGGQIGNGSPTSNKFWSAAVTVIVTAVASFTVMSGVSGQVSVESVANFTRYVGLVANQNVRVNTTANIGRVVFIVSSIKVSAQSVTNMIIGRLRTFSAFMVGVCESIVNFNRQRHFTANQQARVEQRASFGFQMSLEAEQSIRVLTTANFTTFGEYAPIIRTMKVLPEGRTMEVIE